MKPVKLKYNNYPIEDCARTVEPLVKKGVTFHQKFTCAKCGDRQTVETPNTFFTTASCEQCGHITDIAKTGCNYLLSGSGNVMIDILAKRGVSD